MSRGFNWQNLIMIGLLIFTINNRGFANVSKSSPPEPLKPVLRVYTDKDGLPQRSAMSMAYDQKGYLWVGTQDGACAPGIRHFHLFTCRIRHRRFSLSRHGRPRVLLSRYGGNGCRQEVRRRVGEDLAWIERGDLFGRVRWPSLGKVVGDDQRPDGHDHE